MAKGEFWFWMMKITGWLQAAGLLLPLFFVTLLHIDWSTDGGDHTDPRVGYFLGYYSFVSGLVVISQMIGFNVGRSASETLPYVFEWIFGGITCLFFSVIAFISSIRAGQCRDSASTYCVEEGGLLTWIAVTSWALLAVTIFQIIASALLFRNRRSYDTKYKMSSPMTGTSNKAIPTANKAVQMFVAK